ncbi:MAG: ribonuclease III [Bacilli bacterium]|jgi:ribonuclease-3
MKKIKQLLQHFKIKPRNQEAYLLAFTHASFNHDVKTTAHDYERLEFMGDAVIGFVVAQLTYRLHPQMNPGLMTKTRAKLVQGKNLATLARFYQFDQYIRLGQSLENSSRMISDRILEDVFEAFFGAVYLDQGLVFTVELLEKIFYDSVKNIDLTTVTDYKSQLQEAMQAETQQAVTYVLDKTEGPAHDRTFTVSVIYNEVILGSGKGKTKQQAEQMAAKLALEKKAF